MLALECGAAWVDIEFEAPKAWKKEMVDFAHRLGKKVIVSSHNIEETPLPKELYSLVDSMQGEKADVLKLACQVNSKADCARLLSLYERYKNILVIGMGPIRTIT